MAESVPPTPGPGGGMSPTPPPFTGHGPQAWQAPRSSTAASGSGRRVGELRSPSPSGSESSPPVWLRRFVYILFVVLLASTLAGAVIYRSRWVRSSDEAALLEQQLQRTESDLSALRGDLEDSQAELTAMTSERDDLELRVSELSNEKANVQDERNAAQELSRLGADAAEQMLDCRNRLLDVMESMLYASLASVNSQLDAVTPICQSANSAVAAFADAAA